MKKQFSSRFGTALQLEAKGSHHQLTTGAHRLKTHKNPKVIGKGGQSARHGVKKLCETLDAGSLQRSANGWSTINGAEHLPRAKLFPHHLLQVWNLTGTTNKNDLAEEGGRAKERDFRLQSISALITPSPYRCLPWRGCTLQGSPIRAARRI